MIESSNMSHEEYFRVNGSLSEQRTEQILDDLHGAQSFDVREYASYAQEAQGGFPAEDFLADVISDLHSLAKNMRGNNKEQMLYIIGKLDDIAQCQFNDADFGREQLGKIIATIKR